MSDSTIQQARDALAKWRAAADASQPWLYEESSRKGYYGAFVYSNGEAEYAITGDATDGNARLIVGTAGNPDLLDALDGILARGAVDLSYYASPAIAIEYFGDAYDAVHRQQRTQHGVAHGALAIAAAIIAADERMTP